MTTETIKLQLVQTILNLPEDKLAAVHGLLTSIAGAPESDTRQKPSKLAGRNGKKTEFKKQKAKNPMLALIGCVSYEPPLKSIDEELYGESPL